MIPDANQHTNAPEVLRLLDLDPQPLAALLGRYGMQLRNSGDGNIPGSYWGDEEAGLVGDVLYARPDTPLHSVLHEACHYVCMDSARRGGLHTDAGGDYEEENAVCYLQILLADQLPYCDRARMQADMDRWGYSFRLGSARRWFEEDAGDALEWLQKYGLVDAAMQPTWRLRD